MVPPEEDLDNRVLPQVTQERQTDRTREDHRTMVQVDRIHLVSRSRDDNRVAKIIASWQDTEHRRPARLPVRKSDQHTLGLLGHRLVAPASLQANTLTHGGQRHARDAARLSGETRNAPVLVPVPRGWGGFKKTLLP